jgi:hypothetical protein
MMPETLTQLGAIMLGTLLLLAGACVAWFALALRRGSYNEYERNRARVKGSFSRIFFGTVPTFHDGVRDDKVSAGIALDRSANRWVEQGRLSDEALEDVLAP